MNFFKKIIHTVLSISGFVPEHMTVARSVFMAASVLASIFLLPKYAKLSFAVSYFAFTTLVYIGFIFAVLPEKGLRLSMIKKFGKEDAYLFYEGFLAFAFFHNGAGLTFISQSSAGSGFWGSCPQLYVFGLFLVLLLLGLVTKIWSAYVVGIPIYYWKDMFLGRGICEFCASGPYKYLTNPMYGVGQLQVYAIAVYYNSIYGLLFGAVNQALVFLFYFVAEKKFIQRVYLSDGNTSCP
jgi:hypothetical protein